jgi:adenylate cyclase
VDSEQTELGIIIVVDDEKIITRPIKRLLKRQLRREGLSYRVEEAQSAQDALNLIKGSDSDLALVISDIMMQPVDGLEFLRTVKAEYPETFLMVLTGYADEFAVTALKEEIELYSFQEKPWDDEHLIRIVKNALDGHRRKKLLNRYVPEQIVDAVMQSPDDELIEGIDIEVTILFLDIRDSTRLFHSEIMEPKKALEHLNNYFREFLDVLEKHDGVLDKFMGDGILALFGVPSSNGGAEQDAKNAVLSALDMRDEVNKLNQQQIEFPLTIGIGISTGRVIAGNIGSERRANFTVLGNHVNIAARLEEAAKPIPDGILISQSTYQYVKDIVKTRPHTPLPRKGNRDEIQVYEVLGRV